VRSYVRMFRATRSALLGNQRGIREGGGRGGGGRKIDHRLRSEEYVGQSLAVSV